MLRCAILVSIFTLSRSFLISRTCVLNRVRLFDNDATAGCADKWPGDRPPIGNLLRIEQTMDASWGRGKYRTEVWEGNDNPVDDWWEAYTPSKEEQEAAAAGYDFSHPKQWFEERGIDYEKARAETERLTQLRYEEFKQKREEQERNFNFEDFMEMLKVGFRVGFRKRDNELQAAKGQPSLDDEDTGKQWLSENKATREARKSNGSETS